MGTDFSYYVTCPKGVEDLLITEVAACGAVEARIGVGGVHCRGDLAVAYEICLQSRLANRLLCILAESAELSGADDTDLYQFVRNFAWEGQFTADESFAVDFVGASRVINNTQYGAIRVKDAIADRFVEREGRRPNVDKSQPDIRINARLHRDRLTLALDLSGESLHKRGYRAVTGSAPLKENLAAAILYRCGWPELAEAGGTLIDPMCGSGTLLIEAAWMAAKKPPGLHRSFGFERWLGHDATLWQGVRQQAVEAWQNAAKTLPVILGFDRDARALKAASANVARAECTEAITLGQQSIDALSNSDRLEPGLILCNPPYGERLGQADDLEQTYLTLARSAKLFPGWRLAVFTGNADLAKAMRLRSSKRNRLYNGPIPAELIQYDLVAQNDRKLRADPKRIDELNGGALMVANRLRKNLKSLRAWRERENIHCYRVYDADMPEYSAAIDVYEGRLHVQEYAPPRTVDPTAAARRLRELCTAVAVVFEIPIEQIHLKTRKRHRGTQQYEAAVTKHGEFFSVREAKAKLLVNLSDYLDTGLFLDHRPLRLMIGEQARGKDFLNLFCYTASATVHAALGGAKASVSVDMSKTYTHWAARNFGINNISESRHTIVQADCFTWLEKCRQGFDLILLDPPTFSNSKRMSDVLDVQRDHVGLINRCMELLNPRGTLYFSTNLQSFKFDRVALADFAIEDISPRTIDEDFKRHSKIHSCFTIRHLQ